MPCQVCNAPEAEPHFGGITCRACAAFFRRYFHAKKLVISCMCPLRTKNSHPCRECRIQKCLAAGMDPEKVQCQREKHPNRQKTQKLALQASTSKTPPSLPLTPMPIFLPTKSTSCLFELISQYEKAQPRRSQLYAKRMDETTYYDLCCASKVDCDIMWKIVEALFPIVGSLGTQDKKALLQNFHPKWSFLVAAIDDKKSRVVYESIKAPEDYINMVVNFYHKSTSSEYRMEPEVILKTFTPFLHFYGMLIVTPIVQKGFDIAEYMALAMLIFFDGAYTNLSPECSNLCYSIKNQILRELRSYHIDRESDEMRLFETIDVLQLLQKGESKFYDELLVLEMHNIHIHEDYREMIREHNY